MQYPSADVAGNAASEIRSPRLHATRETHSVLVDSLEVNHDSSVLDALHVLDMTESVFRMGHGHEGMEDGDIVNGNQLHHLNSRTAVSRNDYKRLLGR